MIMSHSAGLLMGLLLVMAWLRWRREQRMRWAIIAGAMAGWAAIIRPLDALSFALPIAVAVIVALRGQPLKKWVLTAAAVTVGAVPFLALQLVLDYGTTHHLFQSPASAYMRTYWPAADMGFKPADPSFHPPTPLVQFREYYEQRLVPEIDKHARKGYLRAMVDGPFPSAMRNALVSPVLLLLVPLSCLGLKKHRWVVAAALPIFILAYTFYPFVLKHYTLAVVPALFVLTLAGAEVLTRLWRAAGTMAILGIVAICLTSLHEINPFVHDEDFSAPFLLDIYQKLDDIHEPAVVLFRYVGGGDCDEEPVYNVDVASPDDATIIRAHDLGARNIQLFEYYANKQPERAIYRYNRKTLTLERLGTARELAAVKKQS